MTTTDRRIERAMHGLNTKIEGEFFPFLRIKTISNPEYGLHDRVVEGGEYVAKLLRKRGFHAELVDNTPHPFVVARLNSYDSSKPTVLHYCHFDVQPASRDDPGEKWITDPFEPLARTEKVTLHGGRKVTDTRIYARGSVDDKGPLMAHLWALDAYNGDLPANIFFIVEGTEECGDEGGLEAYIQDNAHNILPTVVTLFDSITHVPGIPMITTSLRGAIAGEYTVTTANAIQHSGIDSGNVLPNPIDYVMAVWGRLKGPDGRVLIPRFYEGRTTLTPEMRAGFEALPFDQTAYQKSKGARWLQPSDEPVWERLWFEPTLEAHRLRPGMDGSMIPPEQSLKFTIRIAPGQDPRYLGKLVEQAIRGAAREYRIPEGSLTVAMNLAHALPAFSEQQGHPIIHLMEEALKSGFGVDDFHYVGGGGSIPQAYAFQHHMKCPVIVSGLAEPGSNYHGTNENILLKYGLQAGIRSHLQFYEMLAAYHTVKSQR
ncbi:M20/M25/M40 family metallo-hydrolase [Candidatus Woesearchaeota archaeon]|nr:M20/M25/M40 family metallo-hydrolase [Candidatus Woesearchaeota archaeon]